MEKNIAIKSREQKKYDEEIIVVDRTTLQTYLPSHTFQATKDFSDIEHVIYKNISYMSRSLAEVNEDYKQIIPYMIFSHQGKLFVMQRKETASEQRLKNKISLGIGGHIRKEDVSSMHIADWGLREFHEEITYSHQLTLTPLGIINDESNEVGRVHLGVAFLIKGTSNDIRVKSELKHGALMTPKDILAQYNNMESWSQIIFDYLISNPEII